MSAGARVQPVMQATSDYKDDSVSTEIHRTIGTTSYSTCLERLGLMMTSWGYVKGPDEPSYLFGLFRLAVRASLFQSERSFWPASSLSNVH